MKATGKTPDVIVWKIPEMLPLFAYRANATGNIARIRAILYFEILETLCFSWIVLLMFIRTHDIVEVYQ